MNAVFANDTVGNFFNATFVNTNIDAESEEGKKLTLEYGIAIYPTTLFINPNDKKVVYHELGEATSAKYLQRGKTAIDIHQEKVTYTTLYDKFSKGNHEKSFLDTLLLKSKYYNQNNDEILNVYVEKFLKNDPTSEEIEKLIDNIKTLDNIGVVYIYNLSRATKDPQFINDINNWIADLFTGTYIKAVNTKNIALINLIKDFAVKTNNQQAHPIFYYYQQRYYNAVQNEALYLESVQNEMHYYTDKSNATFQQEDSIALNDIKKEYQIQLKAYGMSATEMNTYIDQNIQGNPQAISSISYMAADQINNSLELIFSDKVKYKNLLPHTIKWGEKMMDLMKQYDGYSAFLSINYAKALLQNGQTQEAKTILAGALKKASDNDQLYKEIKVQYDLIK